MSVSIKCFHCSTKPPFIKWDDYARHILEKHPEDQERCTWAKHALATGDANPNPIVIDKPRKLKIS